MFSLEWFKADNGAMIGVGSNCESTGNITLPGDLSFFYCADINPLNRLNGTEEIAIFWTLCASAILGFLALLQLLINLFCIACCPNAAGLLTSICTFLCGGGILASFVAYMYRWDWNIPVIEGTEFTNVGNGVLILLPGILSAWIATILIHLKWYKHATDGHRATKSEYYPKDYSQSHGLESTTDVMVS